MAQGLRSAGVATGPATGVAGEIADAAVVRAARRLRGDLVMPGDKSEPKGFILTAVLGIVGAFVATYLGQAVGWYAPGESTGFIGAVVGSIILLFLYGLVMGRQGRA